MRRVFTAILFLAMLPGCAYYEITDPSAGRRYVTDNWHLSQNEFTGSIEFTDLATHADVVLQSSEKREITSGQADNDIAQGWHFTTGDMNPTGTAKGSQPAYVNPYMHGYAPAMEPSSGQP